MKTAVITPSDGIPCWIVSGMHKNSLTRVQLVCYRACTEIRIEVEDTSGTRFHQELQDINARPDTSTFDKWNVICSRVISECLTSIGSIPHENWRTAHDLLHAKCFSLRLSRQGNDVQVHCSGPSTTYAYNIQPISPTSLGSLAHLPSYASTAITLVTPRDSYPLKVELATMPGRLLRFKPLESSSKDADTGEVYNASLREILACDTGPAAYEEQQTSSPSTRVLGKVADDGRIIGVLLSEDAADF